MVEHGIDRVVHRASTCRDLSVRLLITSQWLPIEEPHLVGWDGDIAPDRDHPVLVHSELHLVALADAQCTPDLLRQGELCLSANLRSSADPRSRLLLCSGRVHRVIPLRKSDAPTILPSYYP